MATGPRAQWQKIRDLKQVVGTGISGAMWRDFMRGSWFATVNAAQIAIMIRTLGRIPCVF
jgi:hypothetical protein